jgi:hypothetical protein
MSYVYTILIPLGIIYIVQLFVRTSIFRFRGIISLLFTSMPYLYGYGFLIYYLESEELISPGWKAYSYFFFLIPISLVIFLLKVFFHFTKRDQQKINEANKTIR